ncbi:MAG: T9SS type A sorting domain-containing protein [candidate division Zixibacteria bacterium]|nr:T9SS type A sorting domain-containing protein [candidate division Zixibacteria bacterium]
MRKIFFVLLGLGITFLPALLFAQDSLFSPAVNYDVYLGTWDVYSADIDGDNDYDLVTADFLHETISTLKNNGDGTFQPYVYYEVGQSPRSVIFTDIDGDNDNDIVAACHWSHSVSILRNNGYGTFHSHETCSVDSFPFDVFSADFDGDNDNDLVVSNEGSDNISILLNNGDGTFQEDVTYGVCEAPLSVFSTDLDGDNDYDLAVGCYNNSLSILFNNGDGTFLIDSTYGMGNYPYGVYSADFDNDNDNDLAVTLPQSDLVSIMLNNGDGTFQPAINYGTGQYPRSVFSTKIDYDNYNDLIIANSSDDNISVLLNNRDGTFRSGGNYDADDNPGSVFSVDLNGDTLNDLAVANRSSFNVSILFNIRRLPIPYIEDINNTPLNPIPYDSCLISATITDINGVIVTADISYDTGTGYNTLPMSSISDSFFVTLPGQPNQTNVTYFISATDDSSITTVSDTLSYYVGVHQGPIITDIVKYPEILGHMELCEISAQIIDPFLSSYVAEAKLYYDSDSGYIDISMNNTDDSFYATIPGHPEETTVYYYLEASNSIEYSSYSDTFSFFVSPDNCLNCSAITSTPRVPNENGIIMWDLDISNCGLQTIDVYGEIYPTIGDCAGTQYDFNVRNSITNGLAPGESYTGYYYYDPGTVNGVVDAALSIDIGFAYGFWLGSCCFEFSFTYPWGLSGGQIVFEKGIWGEIGDESILPEVTVLKQNYPNPFNATSTILFDIAQESEVHLSIYNLAGQRMETLVDGFIESGKHKTTWDASTYSSGVYFCKLTAGKQSFTKRMTLLK